MVDKTALKIVKAPAPWSLGTNPGYGYEHSDGAAPTTLSVMEGSKVLIEYEAGAVNCNYNKLPRCA